MEQFYLQYKDEQKWASNNGVYLQKEMFLQFEDKFGKLLEKIAPSPDKYAAQIEELKKDLEKNQSLGVEVDNLLPSVVDKNDIARYHKKEYITLNYPISKGATRLALAYKSTMPFLEGFSATNLLTILDLMEQQIALYIKNKALFIQNYGDQEWRRTSYQGNNYSYALGNWERYSYLNNIKEIKKFEKDLSKNLFIEIRATTENSLMDKKAWAIFCQFEYQGEKSVGYKAKNGELGDISTARLFDSDKGAKRTASAMGLSESDYDIIELQVTYKKRCRLTAGFNSQELDEAEAILEKQRIEAFFNDISVDKIEEKLEEVKAKKKNKI